MKYVLHLALAVAALIMTGPGQRLAAQDQRDDWFHLPGNFNWQFLGTYPAAARLFNAFDYGHAVLYERLYTGRGDAAKALEKEFTYLTTDLLVRPPRFAVVEEAVMPSYAKVAWRAKQMFDWAHLLHRQIFDIYSDNRLGEATRDSLVERVTDYYLARREYAFAPVPKSMDLMEGQYFSRTFRQAYPKFNGLIWAYHWLQVGLYEPLIEGRTPAERKAGVDAALGRFWSMLEDPPSRMPAIMPMASAIAPRFSERHPRAAAIFDNLHMMHDIISDVLTADTIPHDQKRALIYAQLDELRDSTRNIMTWDEWRNMGEAMGGIALMGGPATGLVPSPPTPSGAEMGPGHMQHGRREQAARGQPEKQDSMGDMGHMQHAPPGGRHEESGKMGGGGDHTGKMKELYRRLVADPVISRRIAADTALHHLVQELLGRADQMPSAGAPAKPAPPAEPRPPSQPTPNDSTHHGHQHSRSADPRNPASTGRHASTRAQERGNA